MGRRLDLTHLLLDRGAAINATDQVCVCGVRVCVCICVYMCVCSFLKLGLCTKNQCIQVRVQKLMYLCVYVCLCMYVYV